MNKTELVNAIKDEAELSGADAERALKAFVSAVKGALKKGDSVTIADFGTFVVRQRAARTGRNPRTGESIQIAASRAAAFKPGASLKKELN